MVHLVFARNVPVIASDVHGIWDIEGSFSMVPYYYLNYHASYYVVDVAATMVVFIH